jgi:hypothetical protein
MSRNVVVVAIAFVCGLAVGSGGMYLFQSRQGANVSTDPTESSDGKATITASPVSAPTGDPKLGTTTITWDTGDGSVGHVYVVPPDKKEKLFAENRPKGTQTATWIGKGEYEFLLYSKNRDRVLARVKVKQGQ